MRRPVLVPLGRLNELRARPDADRIGYTMPSTMFGDAAVTVYASRAALKAFCKPLSRHHALVKEAVEPNMLVNRNFQEAR